MAIKVIVELQAKPGGRAELKNFMEEIVADQGPSQNGFLGSTRYEVLDNPDLLIEIADWESPDARMAHMQESAATGVYRPVLGLLASPIKGPWSSDSCPDRPTQAGGGAYDSFSVTGVEILSAECAAGGWWLATNPTGPPSDP